jgi:hypothetical protein
MDSVFNILLYSYIISSTLVTTHTLITILYIQFTPYGKSVPLIIGISPLILMHDPKEMRILNFLDGEEAFLVLFMGFIPLVSSILLISYLFMLSIFINTLPSGKFDDK